MTFFVYVDWTTEIVPRPFYVGKGDYVRIRRTYRNKLHTNIRSKYGFDRRVVFTFDSEVDAFQKECELILEHKTYVHGSDDHWGANFTTGGEGVSGRKHSKETREKMGMGRKGKKHTEDAKLAMSKTRKGKKISETHRLNIKKASTGRKHSDETRAKLSELAKLQHAKKYATEIE